MADADARAHRRRLAQQRHRRTHALELRKPLTLRVGRLRMDGDRLEQLDPKAFGRPADIAIVEGFLWPAFRRRVDPAPARLEDMDDAADHPTVVDSGLAPCVRRQMRQDLRKLGVAQPEKLGNHLALPFGSCESRPRAYANLFMGLDPI